MQHYSRRELDDALQACQLQRGGLVLVHTALYAPGRLADTPLVEISSRLYAALRRCLGRQATIVVPAFFEAFRRGEPFDRQSSPATGMGSFAEYIRLLPGSHRSPHALHSLAANGPLAEAISQRDTPSAFGKSGPFDALIDYDAQVLSFGCTIESSCLVRWAEERVGVPYRRWMICRGRYIDDGHETRRSFHTYSGHDGRHPNLCLKPVHHTLHQSGQLHRAELGASVVESCRAQHFVVAATEILRRDPRALLGHQSTGGQHRSQSP